MNKSNAKAESLRIEGNELFNRKCYHDAMVKYNQSLCLAAPRSEMLGLAYANRSAVYFEMKLFDNCMRNITLAKQNQCPEVTIEILIKREAKCLTALRQSNRSESGNADIPKFFNLSYPSHKKLPFMADCLELRHNDKYGRHIVTNKCLKVGDIVAMEEPFCKIVRKAFIHQICSWCFKSNSMDLIPCRGCTTAMFCSDECESQANRTFHKYECHMSEITSALSTNLQMALRSFFTTLSLFGESLDDLQNYLLENANPCTIFDVKDPHDQRAKFMAINSLSANAEVTVEKNILEKIFQTSPELNEMWSKYDDLIANFLKRQIQIATLNYHEIYFWPLKNGRTQDHLSDDSLTYQRGTVAAGNGSYPLASLLNHDCAPNIIKAFIDDKVVLVVQRPIKKGDQLFDNYGYHFANVSKSYRRMDLLKQYRFECDCEACKNDWPLLSQLKVSDRMCLNKAKKCCRELGLMNCNRKKAIVKYKELCEMLDKSGKNFPSLETCSIMQSAAAYLEMSLKPSLQFP
ncbi:SET and MYND domain-containing protein 4-like [Bradysia coprophila]|uniref:SET and MYND domain-containing protein 4-like n=1 Tax=Bradysia coprophila TaxID=38358 RepID=UPI00187D94CF|nr:SET and MYND domain-containing protein 4-like [Bradysia coprophila]